MNPLFDTRIRRLLPRWRDSSTTAALGELESNFAASERVEIPTKHLELRKKEWEQQRSLFFAGDLLSTSIVSGNREAGAAAATYVLGEVDAPPAIKAAARRLLLGLDEFSYEPEELAPSAAIDSARRRVRSARARVRDDLRNALAWADLSHAYASLGLLGKASDAMNCALSLAPENRFLLRSASRLLVHVDKEEHAHWLLRHAAALDVDPWLMAAEISVAGRLGVTPRSLKHARALLKGGEYSAFNTSELAAAVATLNSEAGDFRSARKNFRLSLDDPTDNTVAQAVWAARTQAAVEIRPEHLELPLSFEARTREFFRTNDWNSALQAGLGWAEDQPFSAQPIHYASYLAAVVLDEHEKAIEILEKGRIANPTDWTCLNNLAFSLASLNRVGDAERFFKQLTTEEGNNRLHGVWLATAGLMSFRRQQIAEGRDLYRAAIEHFARVGLVGAQFIAAVFLAREEILAKTPEAPASLLLVSEFSKITNTPEAPVLLRRIEALAADALNHR